MMALYWVPFRPILCPQSVALDKRSTETRAWGRTALLLWVRKARRKESFLCSSWLAVLYTSEKHSALKGDGLSLIKDTHTHTQTSRSDSSFPSRVLKKAVCRSRDFALPWIHLLAESQQSRLFGESSDWGDLSSSSHLILQAFCGGWKKGLFITAFCNFRDSGCRGDTYTPLWVHAAIETRLVSVLLSHNQTMKCGDVYRRSQQGVVLMAKKMFCKISEWSHKVYVNKKMKISSFILFLITLLHCLYHCCILATLS